MSASQTRHPSEDIRAIDGRELWGKRIVLGVTGSVAAYQAPDIARTLIKHGAEVFPVMTRSARDIIHPNVLEWATGKPVVTKLTGRIEHVDFTTGPNRCDLLLIAPCTGNTIGKIAIGIDDSTVTSYATSALGAKIPILIAPAMHETMYDQPIILENIERLRRLGVEFVGPRIEQAKAKLATPAEIFSHVLLVLSKKDLFGMHVLITAGPTYEYLDPVRVITNPSSGKMGAAFASVALARGADVTVVYGPGSASLPVSIKRIDVHSTRQMYEATVSELKSQKYDFVVASAAAADYTPSSPSKTKIPTNSNKKLLLELEPTPKIIDEVKRVSPKTMLIAFKAEAGVSRDQLVKLARERRATANADLMVANEVGDARTGFGSDYDEVLIVDRAGNVSDLGRSMKSNIAWKVFDAALKLRGSGR